MQKIIIKGLTTVHLGLDAGKLYLPDGVTLSLRLRILLPTLHSPKVLFDKVLDPTEALPSDLPGYSSYWEIPDSIGVYEVTVVRGEYQDLSYPTVTTSRNASFVTPPLDIRDGVIYPEGPTHLYFDYQGGTVVDFDIEEPLPLTSVLPEYAPGYTITATRQVKVGGVWVIQVLPLVSITPELYKKNENMEQKITRMVNNTTVNIIKLDSPVDAHTGIIQPVFFRVSKGSTITLHSGVRENVAINLDRYKSAVKTFHLKIGDGVYKETGRVDAGVVFNVQVTGDYSKYLVLDENMTLVTTGELKIW
jgi:hypothetical protein|nr:MAG TPA: hypothetical protein [Caudoviricetes sp.]